MNKSFENIFDKYNITYTLPRKRKKLKKTSAKSFVFHNTNKKQPLFTNKNNTIQQRHDLETTCNSDENSMTQFFFNTSTQGKYCRPTRYNTLNLVRIEKVQNHTVTGLCGDSFNSTSEKELEIKENVSLLANDAMQKSLVNNTLASELDLRRKRLSCSFNLGRSKKSNKNYSQSQYKQLDLSVIPRRSLNLSNTLDDTFLNDKCDETFGSGPSSSPEPSQIIDPLTPTQDTNNNSKTELDLFIDLIQQEDKILKERSDIKNSNCYFNDVLPKTKKPLKGGYEEMFERALKNETVSGSFLKHDRKIGLRYGQQLSIVRLETAYDLTIAVVNNEDVNNKFGIVIAPDMVPQLKEDSIIEAFIDEKSQPYKMKDVNDDLMDVYFEPYKLLIV